MQFSLLLVVLSVLGFVSAATVPPSKNSAATEQCLAHIQGLPTQISSLTGKLTPDKALGSVDEFESAHKKAVDYCCQASVDTGSVIAQYTEVAPQVTQAFSLLYNLREKVPDLGGIQDKFTVLPDSLLECSKKYLPQTQEEA